MRIYTRTGDDGSTALRRGVRVRKDSAGIEALGALDEAQAALGVVRAEVERAGALGELLLAVERDLWVVMAEVAAPPTGTRPEPGVTAVSAAMVAGVEAAIDAHSEGLDLARHFAVPGGSPVSARLDLARTVVRRAERAVVRCELEGSLVPAYLNRLSDLCFVLARASEGEHLVNARPPRRNAGADGDDKGASDDP